MTPASSSFEQLKSILVSQGSTLLQRGDLSRDLRLLGSAVDPHALKRFLTDGRPFAAAYIIRIIFEPDLAESVALDEDSTPLLIDIARTVMNGWRLPNPPTTKSARRRRTSRTVGTPRERRAKLRT